MVKKLFPSILFAVAFLFSCSVPSQDNINSEKSGNGRVAFQIANGNLQTRSASQAPTLLANEINNGKSLIIVSKMQAVL